MEDSQAVGAFVIFYVPIFEGAGNRPFLCIFGPEGGSFFYFPKKRDPKRGLLGQNRPQMGVFGSLK